MPTTRRFLELVAGLMGAASFTAFSAAQIPEAKPAATATEAAAKPNAPAHPLTAKELREAQIAADTEKLYELAQQLKVELDKSSKDTLSLTVVRKAAEIEKLAHSISERMKSN